MRNRGVISHPVISEAARLCFFARFMCVSISLFLSLSKECSPRVTPCPRYHHLGNREHDCSLTYCLPVLTAVDEDLSSEMQGPFGGHITFGY